MTPSMQYFLGGSMMVVATIADWLRNRSKVPKPPKKKPAQVTYNRP